MKQNNMYVLVWSIICFTSIAIGTLVLTGYIHDSDNQVKITQIKEAK